MPTTDEYRKLFERGGWVREELRGVMQEWTNEFCDGLLLRLPTVGINDKIKIHIWGEQVNIDVGATGAYTNDITDDPLKTIGERLATKELVCSSSAEQEGTGSQVRASEEGIRSVSSTVREEAQEGADDSASVSGLLICDV